MAQLILKTIKFYQNFISPILGEHCCFYPSCSEYSYQAIKKYGAIKGLMLSFWRILRCNPWSQGGIDLP